MTVAGFGAEWQAFDQSVLSHADRETIFSDYFSVFPWEKISSDSTGADVGCGSGRWAALLAPRVGKIHLVDASSAALEVAKKNLSGCRNVSFHHCSVDELPFPDGSLDFAYSLGVLHHVPDTAAAIRNVAAKLKSSAPFLLYLYYAFDDSPLWFKLLWRTSDLARRAISRLPFPVKKFVSEIIAGAIYLPLARTNLIAERLLGRKVQNWPLRYYSDKSFYVMRTDALDRFGTRLEHRFTKIEIEKMLHAAGFHGVKFSQKKPSWTVVAYKGDS